MIVWRSFQHSNSKMKKPTQVEEGEGTSMDTVSNTDNTIILSHLVNDVVAFILYMHQQIPTLLPDITLHFHSLHQNLNQLEKDSADSNALKGSLRRQQLGKIRDLKREIKSLDKFVNSITTFQNAFKLVITQIPNIYAVILILGSSPIRPYCVYELCFSHNHSTAVSRHGFDLTKAAQVISRKVIRSLISKGAGSGSSPGPTKLFLLVKAPSSFNQPLHFLPKRDFNYSKKIEPFRLRFKCSNQLLEMDAVDSTSQTCSSEILGQSTDDDFIWFQCRHVVKGLAFQTPTEE